MTTEISGEETDRKKDLQGDKLERLDHTAY